VTTQLQFIIIIIIIIIIITYQIQRQQRMSFNFYRELKKLQFFDVIVVWFPSSPCWLHTLGKNTDLQLLPFARNKG